MSYTKSKLTVYEKAKELSRYVFLIFTQAPNKYRYVYIDRLENYSLDVIENILIADLERDHEKRLHYQAIALKKLIVLSALLEMAFKEKVILFKQLVAASKLVAEVENYLRKWVMVTKKEVSTGNSQSDIS